MNMLFMVVSCMLVFGCECMMPRLCIEQVESRYLEEYHESELNRDLEEDDFFLPITEQELDVVYEAYKKSEYQNVFFSSIIANIECEIEARCKDGQLGAIDRYLQYLNKSFDCFLSFRDTSFSNSFFIAFDKDIFLFVLGIEELIEDSSNDFTRDSMHFVHVVKELSAMLEGIQCIQGISREGSLFASYERICLDDEYKNSDEYRQECALVLDALNDGMPLI